MSRVTPPVTKISHAIRRMSSSARSSGMLDQSRHVSVYLPRKLSELRHECSKRQLNSNGSKLELIDRLTAHDVSSRADFHSGHRPAPPTRRIPLMQGFRTSAPKETAHDASTIDFFFMPEVPEPAAGNPFAKLRVPLLPDNYTPDRSANSAHAAEATDEALPRSEISIVAAHPETVLPTIMSEVVGNDGLDVDIGQLTAGFTHTPTAYFKSVVEPIAELKEPGALKQLWEGVVDDVFGPKGSGPKAA